MNFANPGKDESLNSTSSLHKGLPPLEEIMLDGNSFKSLANNLIGCDIIKSVPKNQHFLILDNTPILMDISRLVDCVHVAANDKGSWISLITTFQETDISNRKRKRKHGKDPLEMLSDGEGLVLIDPTNLDVSQLDAFIYKCSFKYTRKMALAYRNLKLFFSDSEDVDLGECVQNIINESYHGQKISNRRSKSYITACQFLAYGAIKKDMPNSFRLLMQLLLINNKNHESSILTILDFRRLISTTDLTIFDNDTNIVKSNFINKFQKKFGTFFTNPIKNLVQISIDKNDNASNYNVDSLMGFGKDMISNFSDGIMNLFYPGQTEVLPNLKESMLSTGPMINTSLNSIANTMSLAMNEIRGNLSSLEQLPPRDPLLSANNLEPTRNDPSLTNPISVYDLIEDNDDSYYSD